MELENYADAVEAFRQTGNYEQSKTLLTYCQGMLLIQEANELEGKGYLYEMLGSLKNAESYFQLLSGIEYGESQKLLYYVQARQFEAKGLTQKAIDLYAELMGICDSDDRYLRLINGIVIQPVTTPSVIYNKLTHIAAQVYQETHTYDGPGSSYSKNDTIIFPDMFISIVGQSGEWYLVETTHDQYLIRLWVPKIRVLRKEPTEPYVFNSCVNGIIKNSTDIYYGPGQEYLITEKVLEPGTPVTVIGEDGMYSLIEFVNETNQLPMCGWVTSVNLTKK
ncbi:hypothetical protein SAMN06297421_104177 [Aristaeella hokkaidonensis]|nr:hypothetical protein SAMN06297421_104177 [Aristaeella hokkaidonensis]